MRDTGQPSKRLAFSFREEASDFSSFFCDLCAISACSAVKGFEIA
jgi:hypothetical protein